MNFPAKRIWWIVLPVALAVLAFQGYWLRKTYLEQQEILVSTARNALGEALEDAVLQKLISSKDRIQLPRPDFRDTLWWEPRNPSIRAGEPFHYAEMDMGAYEDLDLEDELIPDTSHVNMNLPTNPRMVTSMLTTAWKMRPTITDISRNFRIKLQAKHINLPFSLQYGKDSIPHHISVPVSLFESLQLLCSFSGYELYLLQKMTGPVAVSLLIFLLIGGCIWILWRTIIRQQELEIMRTDLISNMTHELKTPVSILHAINESLLTFNGISDAQKAARYLQLSKDELNKLQSLIDGLMLLNKNEGKMPAQEKEAVLLRDVVNTVLNRFDHLPGVAASSILHAPDASLYAHRESLITILSNLVDNAIKYSDKPLKEVTITVKDIDTACVFSVQDNGIGIHHEHIPFLFDKFFRVPHGDVHDVKGYGLGLSYVKELVTRMEGTIQVQSTPDQGSIFTIQIPRS